MFINPLNQSNSIQDSLKLGQNEKQSGDFEEALQKAIEEKDNKKLKEACEAVETYMLTSIFKQMKKSTQMEEGLMPKGDYEKMFEDQLIEKQCENMVKAGGMGLADMMYKQMSQTVPLTPSKVDTGV